MGSVRYLGLHVDADGEDGDEDGLDVETLGLDVDTLGGDLGQRGCNADASCAHTHGCGCRFENTSQILG